MPDRVVEAAPPFTTSKPWYAHAAEEALAVLGSGETGLSAEEAAKRLSLFGPNGIEAEEEEGWWTLALRQFRDPLIYILLAAGAVSLLIGHATDAAVILAVLVLNAAIGFIQETRAQQAMRALARLGALRAEVVRGGRTSSVDAEDLVPGDLVLLVSGTRVPADLRLLSATDLSIDESALTGESVPVRKDPSAALGGEIVPGDQVNLAFAGTIANRGRGRGVVIRTGQHTEVGRIAEAVRRVGATPSPLQETVHRLGKRVGLALVGLSGLALVLGLLRGLSASEIVLITIALAVSSVPEGLPVVLTITLALGVRRMAARKAIIRNLSAVETLGSTTVIASDKTGTLTLNRMQVKAIWAGGSSFEVEGRDGAERGRILSPEGRAVRAEDLPALRATLRAGVLANEAGSVLEAENGRPLGDPTEVALLVAAAEAGLEPAEIRAASPRVDFLPFEPERRFMASLHREGSGRRLIALKGAPEVVAARCTHLLGPEGPAPLEEPELVLAEADRMAERGLRVLAIAHREAEETSLDPSLLEGGFTFCGLQGMEDPVRPEAVESVKLVQRAGIRVLMLTGDHAVTARAIGRQLGLGGSQAEAVEGRRLEALSDTELDGLLGRGVDIWARVSPEHKLRIVQRLRAQGEVVAVTGDGVNDAPALRAAELGIAMGLSGTDVAREASDMVLADDNFATIRAAVEEGRIVFANIRKVTFFLLSTAVGEVLAIVVALLFGWPLPFLAAQILWINLVTNGLQDVALAVEPGEPGLLDRKPRSRHEGILSRRLLARLGGVGAVLAVGTLGIFWWTLESTGDVDTARSVAMTQMVVFQFFHVFNCRSLDRSIFRINPFSNRFLFLSLVAALLAQLAVLHWSPLQAIFRTVALDAEQWGLVVAVGAFVIAGGELDKWWNRRRVQPLG